MARFAVDAPVVIKCFVPENYSSAAARLLDGGNELLAADTVFAEAAGIITAKIRLDEITVDEGAMIVEAVRSVPLRIQPGDVLLEPALNIAAALDFPFRDGLGIALAVQAQCRLVTANRTIYDKVQGTSFARCVKWVGDLR
jgi:predicted nucleic acid-binding protein